MTPSQTEKLGMFLPFFKKNGLCVSPKLSQKLSHSLFSWYQNFPYKSVEARIFKQPSWHSLVQSHQ